MENPYDALQKYVEHSEKREIIPGKFYARMSPDIAKNFDSGMYDIKLDDHKKCIYELDTLGIRYPLNVQPKFYMYIVPDENFIELLNMPHKRLKSGGCPVPSYDADGFIAAYGTSQNLLVDNGKSVDIMKHINLVHEYAHLIKAQFCFGAVAFAEGVAELIPWYVLEYEGLVPSHFAAMKSMKKIYTMKDLLNIRTLPVKDFMQRCSFQPSYMSAYLWVRAVVERMRVKYNLSRVAVVQKFLEFYRDSGHDKVWFVMDLAKETGMDVDKLLGSAEYQVEALKQVEKEQKTNKIIVTKERN